MELLQKHMSGAEEELTLDIGRTVVGMRFSEIWLTPEEVHTYLVSMGTQRTLSYMRTLMSARVKTS